MSFILDQTEEQRMLADSLRRVDEAEHDFNTRRNRFLSKSRNRLQLWNRLPEVFSSARTRTARFREEAWTLDEQSPRLSGAHALFDGFTERMIDHHSHTMFVGGVSRIETTAGSDPLLCRQAAYHRLIRASSLEIPATSTQAHSLL